MAEILPGANQVLSFLGEDEISQNDEKQVTRTFQRTKTLLQQYSNVLDPEIGTFNHKNSPYEAVDTTNEPVIPMLVSLIPPDTFPSGTFTKTTVSAPQGLNTTLVRTQRDLGSLSRNPTVTESRVVDGGADEGNPIFSPEAADTETQVSVADPDEEARAEFRSNLREEYRQLTKQAKNAFQNIDRKTSPIVEGRDAVRDDVMINNELIKAARKEDGNEVLLRRQVQAIRNLPPLILGLNPNSFTKSYEHLIEASEKGRDGYIVEHWGMRQPTISGSGRVGAFYINSKNSKGQPTGGLTRSLRRGSAAFQNLMTLFRVYRSNGYIYTKEGRIGLMGSVKFFYDNTIYTGTFDSFSLTETEDAPYTMDYSFDFTVRFEEQLDSESF